METPICDLVIGQHPKVRDPEICMSTKQAESVGTQADFEPDSPSDATFKTSVPKSAHLKPLKLKRNIQFSSHTAKTVCKNVPGLKEQTRKMIEMTKQDLGKVRVKKQMRYRKAYRTRKAINDEIVSQHFIHANKRRKYHDRPSLLTKGNDTTPDLVIVAIVQNNMTNRPSLKVLHLPIGEYCTERWYSSHSDAHLKLSRSSVTEEQIL